MKYLSTIISVIVIAALAFWGYSTLQSNKEEIDLKAQTKEEIVTVLPVRIATAEMMDIDNNLELSGSFEANKEISVFAEGQGRITGLYIEEGQQINKGQKVAKLDDSSIQAQLRTAKAQIEKFDNDIASYTRLLKAGAIAKSQLDDIILGKKNAEANIAAINQQFAYTTAYAPLSGIVKEVPVEQGSFASPGTKIGTIVDVSQLKMIVKVPEGDVVKLKKGSKVNVIADVYPDHVFNGSIGLIGIQADAGRKYEVELKINNSTKYAIKPGMYGTVNIPTSLTQEKALFVPRKSIIGSVKNPQIYVIDGNRAKLTSIKVGAINSDMVKVLEGVEEGQQVITTGQLSLKDGVEVKILENIVTTGSVQPVSESSDLSAAQ